MGYRIETDTIGEIKVEADKCWAAQTERSRNNFKIGSPASMPIEIIHSVPHDVRQRTIIPFSISTDFDTLTLSVVVHIQFV